MGNVKRIEADFILPEAIIQHIQSFLSGRVAARTTILSKAWYSAWLTRPTLDFDESPFGINYYVPEGESRFSELERKTVQRYEKSNLKIESLRLWMHDTSFNVKHFSYSRAHELITKAMKIGAIDLNFNIYCSSKKLFSLPHEVFGSETLVKLSVGGCRINGKLNCSRLESLSLTDMHLERDIIPDVISSCPLIQKLSLTRYPFLLASNVGICKLKCLLLYKLNVDTLFFHDLSSKFPCLKDLGVHDCDGYKGIRISSHSLESISFRRHKMLRVKFDIPSIRKFTFSGSHSPSLSFTKATSNWESDITISCKSRPNAAWFLKLNKLLTKMSPSKVSLTIDSFSGTSFDHVGNNPGLPKPAVEYLKILLPSSECPAVFDVLFRYCRPVFVTQYWLPELIRHEKGHMDFLEIVYERLVQQSESGQCDLEEVMVESFNGDVSAWRPLPWKSLVNDLAGPFFFEPRIRFRLKWG